MYEVLKVEDCVMEPYFLCEVYVSSNGLSENAAYVFWPLMFSERSPKYENDASPVNVRPLAMFIVVFPCRVTEVELASLEVSFISLIMLKPLSGRATSWPPLAWRREKYVSSAL